MMTHQDGEAKTIVCAICQFGFHTKAKLDRHMKSHTKERNYAVCTVMQLRLVAYFLNPRQCELCGKKFLYSYNVTAHIRHVHYKERRKETDRTCTICEKKFSKLWKLQDHMTDAHQIVEEIETFDGEIEEIIC